MPFWERGEGENGAASIFPSLMLPFPLTPFSLPQNTKSVKILMDR